MIGRKRARAGGGAGVVASPVAELWQARGKGVHRALPRPLRAELDELVMPLLLEWATPTAPAGLRPGIGMPPSTMQLLLTTGPDAARLLARAGVQDVETLATAVLLPCWSAGIRSNRSPVLPDDPTGRVAAAGLALHPAHSPAGEPADDLLHRRLGYLAVLPPDLRAVALAVRASAGPTTRGSLPAVLSAPGAAELLGAGLPDPLRAALGVPPAWVSAPPRASVPPLGTPDEAIRRVRAERASDRQPAYGFELWAEGVDLAYRVGYHATSEEVYARLPPLHAEPGSTHPPAPKRAPGWEVDRITGRVRPVDLDFRWNDLHSTAPIPLPPGWADPGRPTLAQGLLDDAGPLARLPVLTEIAATYAAGLADGTWPGYVRAWQHGCSAAHMLLACGADETMLTAVLLLAADPADAIPLVSPTSPFRTGPAAALAAEARTATTGWIGVDRPPPAVMVADACALSRARQETHLFNRLPAHQHFRVGSIRHLQTRIGQAAQRLLQEEDPGRPR